MHSDRRPVIVIGGMNMDIHVSSNAARFMRATSNPATIRMIPGGVARNIAENLALLGADVRLLSAVGDDPISDRLVAQTAASGVDVSGVIRREGQLSGLYVALVDGDGELDTAAADMGVVEAVDVGYLKRHRALVENAGIIVADSNIAQSTLQYLVELAEGAHVRLVLDPVSVAKAERVAALTGEVFVLTPDAAEAAVTSRATSLTVRHTVTTFGSGGAEWSDGESGRTIHIPARQVAVRDVTGAGDAFVAGMVASLAAGAPIAHALDMASQSAATVVASLNCTLSPEQGAELRNLLRGD